jgi:TonB family protein
LLLLIGLVNQVVLLGSQLSKEGAKFNQDFSVNISQYTDWINLGTYHGSKVEVRIKLSDNACGNSGRPYKYEYKVSSKINRNVYVNWRVQYVDCNGNLKSEWIFYNLNKANVGISNTSLDYKINCRELEKPYVQESEISKNRKFGKATITKPNINPDDEHIDLQPPNPKSDAPTTPFRIVEQMPEFPGGTKSLYDFIYKNIEYPAMARENNIEGTVHIQFVVNIDGSVSDITVLRGPGEGLNNEAIRVVGMLPKWKPGKQRGKAVPVYFTLPIKFKLE